MTDSHPAMIASTERKRLGCQWLSDAGTVHLFDCRLTIWRIVAIASGNVDDLPLGYIDGGSLTSFIVFTALRVLGLVLIASGFYMIQPNQAAAITLFGAYRGTDRSHGLRWVWPWMGKTKISVRANNLVSERIKVNDLRGNPIEMAAQVVWRVVDTAQALYDVDDYKGFVMVQIEAAVRTIGSRYPYDDFAHAEITLRGNHDQVGAELRNRTDRAAADGRDHG